MTKPTNGIVGSDQSLQETYAGKSTCFGCGPINIVGLKIRSFATADEANAPVVLDFDPKKEHEAFEGALNGGVLGTLLDCHMNWTTIFHLMKKGNLDHAPCCVTSEFRVQMKRPTPSTAGPLHIEAKVTSSTDDRADVEATVTAGGKVTAIGSGTFVKVKEGHPAYHRW